MIYPMTTADVDSAAEVYSLSWVESHRTICSEAVLQKHSPQRKADDLNRLLDEGWQFWLDKAENTVCGLIGVHAEKGEIAYLYVLPTKQGKGIGGSLLKYAIGQIPKGKNATLWTLNTNIRAEAIYAHYGFRKTGNVHVLNERTGLLESEWVLYSVP